MISLAGCGLFNPAPNIAPALTYSGPPAYLIRWDGTCALLPTSGVQPNWYNSAGFNNYFPNNATYNYRKPIARTFAQELGTTPEWSNGSIMGPGINSQDIVNQEIAYASRKIDGWIFDLYPPASMLAPADATQVSDIMTAWDCYHNSVLKSPSQIKFAPLLQWGWYDYKSGIYRTAWNNYLASYISDPLWGTMFSRKMIIFYNDNGASGWQGNVAAFNTLCTALGGRASLYVIAVTTVALATALGADARMVYGPNGALPSGSGEGSFALQVTTDTGTWGALPGEQKIGNFTPGQDRRTFVPATRYTDMGTRPALTTHLTNAVSIAGQAGAIGYSHSEICEGNDPWDAGTYDCCGFARGMYKPQEYSYETDCHSSSAAATVNAVILTGAGWTYQQPVLGAYHNNEMWTSTLNDKVTLNAHSNLLSFDFIGSTALGLGTATVKVDGVAVGTINFAGASAVRQTLFSYTIPGGVAAHTVDVICDGTGQIRCNAFKPKYKP